MCLHGSDTTKLETLMKYVRAKNREHTDLRVMAGDMATEERRSCPPALWQRPPSPERKRHRITVCLVGIDR